MTVALTGSPAVIAPGGSTHHGALSAMTGRLNDWMGALRTLIRQAPTTAAYLAVLLVTTATLVSSSPHAVRWLVASASTNLHNMAIDPVRVLVVSAFWVQSAAWIWLLAPLVVVVMAPAERLLGIGRTLLIFAAGHLGATALTVAAIGVGVDRGLLPHRLTYAPDVGPSYGLVAIAAVLATRLPRGRRRIRLVAIGALLFGLGTAVIIGGDFTDAGHLIAALIGLACSRFVTGKARVSPGPRPPRIESRHSTFGADRLGVIRAAVATRWGWPLAEDDPDAQISTLPGRKLERTSVGRARELASPRPPAPAEHRCRSVAARGTPPKDLSRASHLRPAPDRSRPPSCPAARHHI